jgi:hypothetical protein
MATEGYGIDVSELGSTSDPFKDATNFTGETSVFVQEMIEGVNLVATDSLAAADAAITDLAKLSSLIDALPGFNVADPILVPEVEVVFDVPDIDTGSFGAVEDFNVSNNINTSGLPSISEVTVPGFAPTPYTIDIPKRPVDKIIEEPGAVPENPGFIFPDKIVITLPNQPDLAPIVIPTTPVVTLPDFEPIFPTFQERTIQTMIDWQEPVYTEEVIDEVKLQISRFFAGGSGIDPIVENNIFARGRDREDRLISQQEQQATEEWATKGYTAPPGMLVKRIDNIREEGTLKKLGLNREQTIKVFDTEIENLRFATQQGIAAEQLYVQMFLAKVERLFEVQKLNIQWQIELYGLAIQVFNIQMEEVKVRVIVYEAQVRVAMLEIEIFKVLVEAEKVKADMNKVLIDAYIAEIGAREAMVRMYGEQVKAVGIEADVFKTEVQAYGEEVDAFAARVSADKTRFDAYAVKVEGEGVKAEILSSEARAYQSQIQGIATGVTAEVAALEGEVSAIEVQIRNFEAIVRGQIGRAQVQLGQVQANVAGNNANTQRFVAKTGAEEAVSKVELAAWEGTNRTNLEIYKANLMSFQAILDRAVKEIELSASTQGTIGQLSSTIAAGAMAAMHVGANLGATSGVSSRGGLDYSSSARVSCSTSNNSNLTWEANQITGHPCPTISGNFDDY